MLLSLNPPELVLEDPVEMEADDFELKDPELLLPETDEMDDRDPLEVLDELSVSWYIHLRTAYLPPIAHQISLAPVADWTEVWASSGYIAFPPIISSYRVSFSRQRTVLFSVLVIAAICASVTLSR